MLEFDEIIHLAGEQTIPNYMAIRLANCKRHLFLVTERTAPTIARIKAALSGEDIAIETRVIPATDFAQMVKMIDGLDVGAYQGRNVGVNLTGGTKPMFAIALRLSEKYGFTPFYLDTDGRKIQFFSAPYDALMMPPVFSKVSEYLSLAGYDVGDAGRTAAEALSISKRRFLRLAWQYREIMQRVVGKFAESTDGNGNRRLYQVASEELEGITQRYNTGMLWSEWACCRDEANDWKQTARLGAGIWLEEWLLKTFDESKNRNAFIDLRTGIKVRARAGEKDMQEIDVAFTDGYKLYLMECKAGRVEQEHVQKLENLRRALGGAFGVGFICSINDYEALHERIGIGSISMVTGDVLPSLPNNILHIRSGRCYSKPADFK